METSRRVFYELEKEKVPIIDENKRRLDALLQQLNVDQLLRKHYDLRHNALIHGMPQLNPYESNYETLDILSKFFKEGLGKLQ